MKIAPSTYYAAVKRQPCARAVRDEQLKPLLTRVHQNNYGVYGIRKMHAALAREPDLADTRPVARCTTQRLMRELGLRGISRAKGPRTTVRSHGRVVQCQHRGSTATSSVSGLSASFGRPRTRSRRCR